MSDDSDLGSEKPAKGHRGEFFGVDWRCVEDATRYGDGVNTAIAYITLARFTGRSQSTTLAGMTAVHTRTGMTRGRADLAIKTLERAGLLTIPTKGTRRDLVPWGLIQKERTSLTAKQEAVLQRVLGNKEPITSGTDPDYQTAYSVVSKGILELTKGGAGKSRFRLPKPDLVWLPNALVDGFGQGDTPLARLRQIRDPRAILLLLDCYRFSNLAEDGGLPWQAVRQTFKRLKIHTYGHFSVWGFVQGAHAAEWDPVFSRFKGKGNKDTSNEVWQAIDALRNAGLVEYVGHIVEGLTEGAQVVHPYALPQQGEAVEQAVARAAHAAGRRMITDHKYSWAREQLGGVPLLCPVRSHMNDVELVGILRVVHRPHTSKTAAWASQFLHQCEAHKALFESLRETAISSVA